MIFMIKDTTSPMRRKISVRRQADHPLRLKIVDRETGNTIIGGFTSDKEINEYIQRNMS